MISSVIDAGRLIFRGNTTSTCLALENINWPTAANWITVGYIVVVNRCLIEHRCLTKRHLVSQLYADLRTSKEMPHAIV